MKHITLIALFVWVAGTICSLSSQSFSLEKKSEMAPHPRLLLLKGEEKALMKKVNKDAVWKALHRSILEECDRIVALPVNDRRLIGRRLLSVSRENLRRIFLLSYAYRTTQTKRYAQRAEAEMLKAASFENWNPTHYLDVAEMTLALSIGYDWLFDILPAASRTVIKEAIIRHGLDTSEESKYNHWLKTDNNWNQVCNAGITFGALALYEEFPDRATALIDRAVRSVRIPMKEYAPDGAYPEGIGYWEYGTSFNVLLLGVLERLYGHDGGLSQMEGFMPTGLYSQQMITPAGNAFCYADNGTRIGFNSTVFWFYSKLKDPALLYMQKKALENDSRQSYLRNRLLPLAILYGAGSGASLDAPPLPSSLMWVGQGASPVAVMRTSWDKPGAWFVGFKAGSPSSNHGHMDVGSFFFEADGVRWSLDLGMQNYNEAETAGVDLWNKSQESQRWDVYRYANLQHSTLTFNQRKQKVDGYANLDAVSGATTQMSVSSDITSVYLPWAKEVRRSVSLVHRAFVVVEDRIVTGQLFTPMRWNMVTEAEAFTAEPDGWFTLTKGDRKLYVKVECPSAVKPYLIRATPPNSYDQSNTGVSHFGFDTELPRNASNTVKVYMMLDKTKDITTYKGMKNEKGGMKNEE